jgi:predicted deacylase
MPFLSWGYLFALLVLAMLVLAMPSFADDDLSETLAEEKRAAEAPATVMPEPAPPVASEQEAETAQETEQAAEQPAGEVDPGAPAAEPVPAEPPLPQAENINLREVIDRPLLEVLPQTQTPVPELQTPGDGSMSPLPVETETSPPVSTPAASTPAAPPAVETLRMLGAEVLPGTATRLAWSVKDSLAGISVPTPVLVVHGKNPGPRVCLTAALHGDELNGIEVVRRILYDLQPEKLSGTVIGVPIVNLQGFRRASRYLPDRRDLNRYFPGRPNGSSAARIAHSFFHEVIVHCHYLVDLHTGSFRRTNLPQLRADLTTPAVAELTRHMGAIVVLQSKGARGSLRRAAVDAGIPSVTVEAGEPLNVEPNAVQQGVQSIEALLSKLNMYPYKGLWARKSEPVYYKSRWVRAPAGGILLNRARLGERIKRNQLLGVVTDPITNVAQEIHSPISGRVIGMALNQVMLPGFAAYHIGYQSTAEEAAEDDAGPDEAAGDDAEVEESEAGLEPLS